MNSTYDLGRTSCLLLSLAMAACNGGGETETSGESSTSTGTDSTESDPSMPTTVEPTEGPTTVEPTTVEPTTVEPTTIEPTTIGPTTETTDTTTTTGPDTDTDPVTATETDTNTDTTIAATDTTTDTTVGTDTDTTVGTDTDETSTTETETEGGESAFTAVWATANPAGLAADLLESLTPALDAKNASLTLLGEAVSIQSIGVNAGGDAIITFDAPGTTGGVAIYKDFTDGNPLNGPLGLGSRSIRGPATGLIAPKGVEATGPTGQFIVADTGAADIKVFLLTDTGDVAPQFTITDLGSSAAVWDVHYVANGDTLYAAGTNGEVQVYEQFKVNKGQNGPDRTIIPSQAGNKISVNLHGITVDSNTLYLSDVGDPMNTTDGQIFVIDGANTAKGVKPVTQRIQGGSLGNPVDLEMRPGIPRTIFVAEKSNDSVIAYTQDAVTQQFTLSKTLMVTKPESVALTTGNRLVVALNPAGIDTDGAQLLAAPLLADLTVSASFDRFGGITSVQSLVFGAGGAGYVSFDGAPVSGGGGVFVIDALTGVGMDGAADTSLGRIWGPLAQIATPKGLELNDAKDRLFVADTGAGDIKVFDTANLGNVAPLFTITDLGGGPVWDVDYDDASDMLYAAGVTGTVRVYENVLANNGGSPVRIITPTNDQNAVIGLNLHGIVYDAVTNTLILSDVGSAMSATDGQIFVIAAADTADGMVKVQAQIGGDQTKLGNPVDIGFDGTNLYVAEKSNSLVLRYDGVLALTGANNSPASASIAVANPESVALAYTKP